MIDIGSLLCKIGSDCTELKKEAGWLDCLAQQEHSTQLICRSLSYMPGSDRNVSGSTGHTADGFAAFFARKVDDGTAGQPSLPVIH